MAQDDGTAIKVFAVADTGDDIINAIIFPVKAVDGPLNWIIATGEHTGDDLVIIVAIRRPEEEHFIAGELFYFFMDRHDFIPNLRVGELAHIFVVLTMIAKIVSGFIDCPDIIRVRFYPAAGHEKRGMYVVFGQNFQNT